MTEHRYILQPYKGPNTRYDCPGCGKRKTFSRYLDTETGEHLNPSVGRCNREVNCGYHYTPKQYFEDNPERYGAGRHLFDTPRDRKQYLPIRQAGTKPKPAVNPQPVSFIPVEVFKKSLQQHTENNFVKFLFGLFGAEITLQLIEKYFIGTSKQWEGATVFWQIAKDGIRTGKIMLYNLDTGKRKKEADKIHISWVHTALKIANFNLKQCFFGEHLLQDKTKPVAIFESEKTAVIASVYFQQFICIACGSLTNLSAEKCKVLQGRNVILYPDLNGFDKWNAKAKELFRLFPGTRFNISGLLERKATETERQDGLDLADYLIRFDYSQQQEQPEHQQGETEQPQQAVIETVQELQHRAINLPSVLAGTPPLAVQELQPESWEQDITELETYFTGITLPTQPVKLKPGETILSVSKFIDGHFATVKTNNGNKTFLPFLNRLQELKQVLTLDL